jgi:hypothetical protein
VTAQRCRKPTFCVTPLTLRSRRRRPESWLAQEKGAGADAPRILINFHIRKCGNRATEHEPSTHIDSLSKFSRSCVLHEYIVLCTLNLRLRVSKNANKHETANERMTDQLAAPKESTNARVERCIASGAAFERTRLTMRNNIYISPRMTWGLWITFLPGVMARSLARRVAAEQRICVEVGEYTRGKLGRYAFYKRRSKCENGAQSKWSRSAYKF